MTATECSTDAGVIIATSPGRKGSSGAGDLFLNRTELPLLMLLFVVVDVCVEGGGGSREDSKPPPPLLLFFLGLAVVLAAVRNVSSGLTYATCSIFYYYQFFMASFNKWEGTSEQFVLTVRSIIFLPVQKKAHQGTVRSQLYVSQYLIIGSQWEVSVSQSQTT